MKIQAFKKKKKEDWEPDVDVSEMALSPPLRRPEVGVRVARAGADLPAWSGGLNGSGGEELRVKY